jgi:hypothetical protein
MNSLTNKSKWLLLMLLAFVLSACSSDKDETPPVAPMATGSSNELLVIFPVDQLGDSGYADEVMSGITSLRALNMNLGTDTLDVLFFMPLECNQMITEISEWLKEGENPFYGVPYKRRLLILADSYMLDWIEDFREDMRPNDEILVLRAVEEDVKPVAAALGLEGRLHALNISAAGSVRKFREFADTMMALYKDEVMDDMKPSFEKMPLFRIYHDTLYHYRDSLAETLAEVFPETELQTQTFLEEVGDALWSIEYEKPLIQVAYDMAEEMMKYFKNSSSGMTYAVVDLGAANGGWDFYLLNTYGRIYTTLMLDATPSPLMNRMAITRKFGKAVDGWVKNWLQQPVGSMPVFEGHGTWDGYCVDDIDRLMKVLSDYRNSLQ